MKAREQLTKWKLTTSLAASKDTLISCPEKTEKAWTANSKLNQESFKITEAKDR